MAGTQETEDNFIVSGDGSQNLDQGASQGEAAELDQSLRTIENGDAGTPAAGHDEGEEEVDLDDLEERAARVDEELQDANTPEERERIKNERKQARIDRRNRARQREEALRREVSSEREQRIALERRIAGLESNQMGVELGQLEQAEANTERAIAQLQDAIAEATVKADGRTVALATTRLQEALVYRQNLAQVKARAEQQARAPKAQHLDPVMLNNSKAWAARNKWYKGPQSNDADSKVLTAIDNSVSSDGFDPRTPEYWQELDARASKYLSHRMNGNAENRDNSPRQMNSNTPNSAARPKQAVAGAGNNGSSTTGGSGRTMILSQERVKAMKESGAWEDPKRKADMIKRYREQDARDGRR